MIKSRLKLEYFLHWIKQNELENIPRAAGMTELCVLGSRGGKNFNTLNSNVRSPG